MVFRKTGSSCRCVHARFAGVLWIQSWQSRLRIKLPGEHWWVATQDGRGAESVQEMVLRGVPFSLSVMRTEAPTGADRRADDSVTRRRYVVYLLS
jgi:hypothetical protein